MGDAFSGGLMAKSWPIRGVERGVHGEGTSHDVSALAFGFYFSFFIISFYGSAVVL